MTSAAGQTIIGLGQHAVVRTEGILGTLGLGSCVAVVLHDPAARVGGMAHIVLPTRALSRDRSNPFRFAETGVPLLVERVVEAGAERPRLSARLVGGAAMFASLVPQGSVHMGKRNVIACHTALRQAGIGVAAEAVGGERGRSVWRDVATGVVTIRSVGSEPERL